MSSPRRRALLSAARFAEAGELLDAAGAADHPALGIARVEAALARDWHHGAEPDVEALRAARPIVADDARASWTLNYLSVRRDYAAQLTRPDPPTHPGLTQRATALRDAAPDDLSRGWAEFYIGLIADNVTDQRDTAPPHYRHALAAAERQHDDLLIFETLRHLGDHAHDDGDATLARQQWERATRHAARAGTVTGTLAQQLLLAVLARDRGDEAGAALLAAEVLRWAEAIEATRIRTHARAFLAGQDPTHG
jgi:tetratricopeptide (TPR) repeat protein